MSSHQEMPRSDSAEALPQGSPTKAASFCFFNRNQPWKLVFLALAVFLVLSALVSWGGHKRWFQRLGSVPRPFPDPSQHGDLVSMGGSMSLIDLAARDEGTPVPDDSGWIAEMVLNYTPDYEEQVGPSYLDLFTKISGDVRLQICCPSREAVDQFVARWAPLAVSGGRQVVLNNVNRPLSLWPRDRWIARQTSAWLPARNFVPTALSVYQADKQNDLLVPTLLWPTGQVPGNTLISFHLEGGNLLANRRHLFTGINVYSENEDRFEEETDLSRVLEKLFGLSPVLLRDRENTVPWTHADMYLTLLDEHTVLVADPRAGLHLLESMAMAEPAEQTEDSQALSWRDFKLNVDEALQESFDDIAAQMAALGYEVHRLPALVEADLKWMLTYNNALLEHRAGEKIVFLPAYSLEPLDQAATEVYEQFGFEVRTIDVTHLFELGGAVRCLANVTRRCPEEAPTALKPLAYQGTLLFFEVGTVSEDESEQTERAAPPERVAVEP